MLVLLQLTSRIQPCTKKRIDWSLDFLVASQTSVETLTNYSNQTETLKHTKQEIHLHREGLTLQTKFKSAL